MKHHQSHESLDLIRLQRQGNVAPWDSSGEFEGNVSMPAPQPRYQELSARDIALKDDAKGWRPARSGKSWEVLRADKPIGTSVLSADLCIWSECRSL